MSGIDWAVYPVVLPENRGRWAGQAKAAKPRLLLN